MHRVLLGAGDRELAQAGRRVRGEAERIDRLRRGQSPQAGRGGGGPEGAVRRCRAKPAAAEIGGMVAADAQRDLVAHHDRRQQVGAGGGSALGRRNRGGEHHDAHVSGRVGVLLDPRMQERAVGEGGGIRR